jgi:disulfide bond formation protein DsbB
MNADSPISEPRHGWTLIALALAVTGSAGSVYLSTALGLKACPLCFYQRSFVMAAAAVLCVGVAVKVRPGSNVSLLALPLAVSGLGVALFHEYLELTGRLECPLGLLSLGTAPQQSTALLILLTASLSASVASDRKMARLGSPAIAGSAVLGLILALACVWSAPPLPPAPGKPYDEPLLICRPPYESAPARS